jgi:hypothetical protein
MTNNYFKNTSTVNIKIKNNMVLDSYRIFVLNSDNPLANAKFALDQEKNGSYTLFSWRQRDVNTRNRISSTIGKQASPLSSSTFPAPTSNTVSGTLSDTTVNITDPLISTFSGDLYCLLKIQSLIPGRLLKTLKTNSANPSATIIQSPSAYGSGSPLYNNSAVYFRGNGGTYTGNFSNTFVQSDNLGIFGPADDVGQILFKFPAITANQTQANLDYIMNFQININC